jgi:hypothetical protein
MCGAEQLQHGVCDPCGSQSQRCFASEKLVGEAAQKGRAEVEKRCRLRNKIGKSSEMTCLGLLSPSSPLPFLCLFLFLILSTFLFTFLLLFTLLFSFSSPLLFSFSLPFSFCLSLSSPHLLKPLLFSFSDGNVSKISSPC